MLETGPVQQTLPFHLLASRTRIGAVELIVRKHLLLWWSFCVLEVIYILQPYLILRQKTDSNALTKLRSQTL